MEEARREDRIQPVGWRQPYRTDNTLSGAAGCLQMPQLHFTCFDNSPDLPGDVISAVRSADQDFFIGERVEDHVNCRDHVRIGGHDDGLVEPVLMGLLNKLDDKIGIRPLLFSRGPTRAAFVAAHPLFFEVPEDGRDIVGFKRLDIGPVTNHCAREPIRVGGEVENLVQSLLGGLDKGLRKTPEIEPFKVIHAGIGNGMIEVKAVDVTLHALQETLLKNKKPAALANGLLKVNLKG